MGPASKQLVLLLNIESWCILPYYFKGVIGCDLHFYKLFELKYVLAVCVHNHPIMIKIHPVFFFISLNHFPFLKSSRSQMPVCVTSHRPKPSHDCWLTVALYLRPALSELSSVCHCFNAGAYVDKKVFKRMRWFVVGCNNKYSSRHLLLTSELLKTQWVTFVFEGNASSNLPKCVYVHANHSWASLTYRRTEYKGLLWIFANRLS